MVLAVTNSAQGRVVVVPLLLASDDAMAIAKTIRSRSPREFIASLSQTTAARKLPFENQQLDYVCVVGPDGRGLAFDSAGTTDWKRGTHNVLLSDQSLQDAIITIRDTGSYRGSFVCSLEKSVKWPEDVRTQVTEFLERIPVKQQTRGREGVRP